MHFLKNKAADSFEVFYKFLKQRPNTQLLLTNLDVYPWIKLGSPEYQKLLTHNESNYQRFTLIITLRDLIFKDSLFFSPHWKRQRRILGPYFHHDRLRGFMGSIEKICEEKMAELAEEIMKSKSGSLPIKTVAFSSRITGESIIRFFFSEDFNGRTLNGNPIATEVQELLTDIFTEGSKPFNVVKSKFFGFKYFLTKKEKAAFSRLTNLRSLVFEVINDRRKQLEKKSNLDEESKDLLTVYLQELEKQRGKKDIPPEEKITEEEIVQQFLLLSFAGTDTTAHLVAMALYSLAKYPETHEKIRG
jgi:cytochrome P450